MYQVNNPFISSTDNTVNITDVNTNISGSTVTYPSINPYNPYITYWTYPVYENWDIQLRKVENGWILKTQGKEYIIKDLKDITKFIE